MGIRSKDGAEQFRALAKRMFFSNETVEHFLASSSAAQVKSAAQMAVESKRSPESEAWKTRASQATARVPKVVAQAWPARGMNTAQKGRTPMPTRSGATMATGTPKPVTPCRKLANTQPNARMWSRLFGV